ncbi:MAG: nitrophenyl compound nitroreductase subunit ArsF family protein [Brumimicrobium sp.]
MKKVTKLLLGVSMIAVFASCNSTETEEARATEETENKTPAKIESVEIIQFHSANRCMTCNKIEALTLETLRSFEGVPFRLVNVDSEKNEEEAEEFQATGTALFLHNTKTGDKKELTDFAFMTAHDKDKFLAELKEEIVQFGN